MAISSQMITFIDTTDTQKVDVHISSNYPIIQIYDTNLGTFTPSWIPTSDNSPLRLSATVYADSTDVSELSTTTYQWFKDVDTNPLSVTTRDLIINDNVLDESTTGMVTYICKVNYNGEKYENSITFSLVTTGANGTSAPTVQAQYSLDGADSTWVSTLDSTVHKYIRFSYDGGLNWTAPIKITGEDGQSISLKGTAYTTNELVVGGAVTLYSDNTMQDIISGEESGDSYLVDGYLCVYNGSQFVCTGQLQGPKGDDGATYYLYIRYAKDTNGSDFSDVSNGRKYIGFYRTTAPSLPTNIDKSAATWNWAKFAGDDAKSITLTTNTQVFKIDKNNVVSPTTIKLTAQAVNTTVSSWSYNTDGSTTFIDFTNGRPTGVSEPNNGVVTIDGTAITSDSITIKVTNADRTCSDVLTIYKVSDGANGDIGPGGEPAFVAFLTNEHIPFVANADGQIEDTITTSCNVVSYKGTTKITPTIGVISDLPTGMNVAPNCGTAYTNDELGVGNVVTLFYDSATRTQINTEHLVDGDSYVVGTYLCRYHKTNNEFVCENVIVNDNEVKLTITVSAQSTLGYTSSINRRFGIPIINSVNTTLWLNWSKINTGAKGENAPAVKAQYSSNGSSNWSESFNASTHKYVRFSYDGGKEWSSSMKIVGDNAKNISLNASAQVFKIDKSYTVSPTTITVTAQTVNTTISSDGWTYSTDGGKTFSTTAPNGVSRSENIVTIEGGKLVSSSVVIKVSDGTYSDTLTIYKALDGVDAPIAFLTNENITFSANTQGQISGITLTSNVVAYSGTNKVVPTIGTITGVPTGMTITPTIVTTSNEMKLTIAIANNSTLGSASSNMGTISIPITSPVNTTLFLTWSKINTGATGASIKSTTVSYGVSDSASTRPADSLWQSTIPVVADGEYLWTRTIIDYTDDAIPDTVTYTYAKQGSTGAKGDTGSSGTSVTVKSIKYQAGTSATTAPTGTWSDGVVTVAENNYLWTQTTFSDNKVAYGVAKQGSSGRGVSSIVEQYYQSTSATTQSGGSWSATVPTWADGKYIWTRSVITYTDSATSTTSPVCVTGQKGSIGGTGIGVSSVDVWYYQSTSATALSGGSWSTTAPTWSDGKYVWTKTITTYTNNTTDETNAVCITGQKGSTGVGVKSVTEYYLATASSSGVTTSTSGWTTTIQTITLDKKYLWNYEVVTYTNNTTSTTTPIIIGVFGNTGSTGKGIKSVTEYYLATTLSSDVTTSTTGWTTTMQALTATNKYLWNYELITYTDNSTATIEPVIVGVYGDQGLTGERGSDAIIFQVYSEDGYILSKDTPSITLQTFAYNGDVPIEAEATYQWYKYTDGSWTIITDATNSSLKISHSDVSFSGSYMCKMLFNEIEYVDVATIDDKNDVNAVFTSKPSNYSKGDVWIVGADYIPNGFTTGTLLRAQYPNSTYDDKDWVTATKYDEILNDVTKYIDVYKQYFDFDSEDGLKITASNKDGVKSKFSTTLTNEQLAFNYNDESIAYINGTSMHIKEAEIESPLTVTGKYSGSTMVQAPTFNIGNFSIVVESNGSLSIISNT